MYNQYRPYTLIILALIAVVIGFQFVFETPKTEPKIKIGITQIAPHPSLDKIRQGIEDTLRKQLGNLEVIFENAQGNIGTATQIAHKFASQELKAVITITTPSTQAMLPSFSQSTKPVIFAGVSDPSAAKLTPTDHPNIKLYGVSDAIPAKEQALLIKALLPKENLRVGMIYNPGEVNAVQNLEEMTRALSEYGIKVVPIAASKTTEVIPALQANLGSVDALCFGNDNTIVTALESILRITNGANIPAFSSDPESVERGCVGTVAPNQYDIGVQAGEMTLKILADDKTPAIIEQARNIQMIINVDAASKLNINIPDSLKNRAVIINGKEPTQ